MSIGKRIKELRIKNNMTQQYVADSLNVGKGSVSKWERDETIPDVLKFSDLCNLFDTNLDYLINGKTIDEVNMNKVWIEEEKRDKLFLSETYKNSLIRLENVSKIYTEHNSKGLGLSSVSLAFKLGEFVAITGKSGSGKSTLLNVLTQLDTFDEGEYVFNNKTVENIKTTERDSFRIKYISFVFQKYNVIENISVIDNVNTALIFCKYNGNIEQRSLELINLVGLSDRIHTKAINLSGGQKQRLVIARELAKEAPILALDEPTGNLDYETSKEILDLIYEISKDKLVLLVTHNFMDVKKYATRRIELKDGYVTEDKVIMEVKNKPIEEKIINKINKREFLKFSFRDMFLNKKSLMNTLSLSISLLVIAFTLFLVRSELSYQLTDIYYNNHQQKAIVFSENEIDSEIMELFNSEGMLAYESDLPQNIFPYDLQMITRNGNIVDINMSQRQVHIAELLDNKTVSTGKEIIGEIPTSKYEIVLPLSFSSMSDLDKNEILGSTVSFVLNSETTEAIELELRVVGYYVYFQYQDHKTGELNLLYLTKEFYQELHILTSGIDFTFGDVLGSSEITDNTVILIDDTIQADGIRLHADNGLKVCYFYTDISETDNDYIDKCNDYLKAQYYKVWIKSQDVFGDNFRTTYNLFIEPITSIDYLSELTVLTETPKIELKVNSDTYTMLSSSELEIYYDGVIVYFKDSMSIDVVKSLAKENDLFVYYDYDIETSPEQDDFLQYQLYYVVVTLIAFMVFFIIEYIVNRLFKHKLESVVVLRSIGARKNEISIMLFLQNLYLLVLSIVFIFVIFISVYLINIDIKGVEINRLFKNIWGSYITNEILMYTVLIYVLVKLVSTIFIIISIYKKSINAVLAEIR